MFNGLRKCPFCGERFWLGVEYKPKKHKKYPYRVKCFSCFTRSDWFKTKKAAIDNWNERCDDGHS